MKFYDTIGFNFNSNPGNLYGDSNRTGRWDAFCDIVLIFR